MIGFDLINKLPLDNLAPSVKNGKFDARTILHQDNKTDELAQQDILGVLGFFLTSLKSESDSSFVFIDFFVICVTASRGLVAEKLVNKCFKFTLSLYLQ